MSNQVPGWILDEKVMPNQNLTQGDLIVFSGEKNPLRQAGVVVTADCDLEKRKHGRLVTLVPVVSVHALLEYYLLIEACEKLRKQIFEFACKKLSIEASEEDAVSIAELRMKVDELRESEPASACVLAADFILHRVERLTAEQYQQLMTAIGSKAKAASSMEDQIKKKGDIVVLPSPKALGVEGDIAWVRHIWQVSLGKIAMKTSDVNENVGERVARLESPFRYRVAQIMGQVFSDIGLPDVERSFQAEIEKVLG